MRWIDRYTIERQEDNLCLYTFAHRPEYSGRVISVSPSILLSTPYNNRKYFLYIKMVNHFTVTREREKKNTIWILFIDAFLPPHFLFESSFWITHHLNQPINQWLISILKYIRYKSLYFNSLLLVTLLYTSQSRTS